MEEKMIYKEFCGRLTEEVKCLLSADSMVEVHDVVKNNGIHLDSLTIRDEDRNLSPNFYLKQFYDEYRDGKTLKEIAEEIVCMYHVSEQECEDMELDFTFGTCREKIVLRLASGVWNEEILESVPHIPFLDMVILFYVVLRVDEEGIGSVRVTNQLQSYWDISTQELFQLALKNSKRLFPEKIGSLIQVLQERMPVGEQEDVGAFLKTEYDEAYASPFVITNTYGINGATVILYPEILKEMGKMFGGDYYLLPSSIHEFLAVPNSHGISGDELGIMVKKVNSTCVAREELLSEKVYYYNIAHEKISVWEEKNNSFLTYGKE